MWHTRRWTKLLDLQSILACRNHNHIQSTGEVQDAVCGQGARFIESSRCRADHLAWRSPASAFPLSLVPERVPDSVQLDNPLQTLLPGLFAIHCDRRCVSNSVYLGLVNRRGPYFCTVVRLWNRHDQNIATSSPVAVFFSPLLVCRVKAPSHFLWRSLAGLSSTNNKISRRPFCVDPVISAV